jgi:hypothetical protein
MKPPDRRELVMERFCEGIESCCNSDRNGVTSSACNSVR